MKFRTRYIVQSACALALVGTMWLSTDLLSDASARQSSARKAVTPEPVAIYKVDTPQKVLALTFDISWGEKAPGPILDILAQKHVTKATFFLSGPWVSHHVDIAKRIKSMGFEIASHGYMHKNYTEYNDAWIRDQVTRAERSIQDVTGIRPKMIRTPNGDLNQRVITTLTGMHYKVIQWNTDSRDWMNPGVEAIKSRVLTKAVPGDIILMHASDSCKQTHLALPAILDGLREKGYQFVTVSELLAGAQVQTSVQ